MMPTMNQPAEPPVIAVINSSEEVVTMLRELFEEEGFRTVAGHIPEIRRGEEDLIAFFEQHDPAVVVWDIALPYEENWTFFRLVQNTRAAQGRSFILTTTNRRALEDVAGDTGAIEVVGKPFDLEEILSAVRRALERGGMAPA
jgi:DNA-binding response OmpR family regulator